MPPIDDHPLRYTLANELHARPFPAFKAPQLGAYVAIKRANDANQRDRAEDLAHLIKLLDRHGAQHPQPGATHYSGAIGRHWLKWEQHTEFVTYSMFSDGLSERPFDSSEFDVFPADWLAEAPGQRITSILLRIDEMPAPDKITRALAEWFVPESLSASYVLDRAAIIAGDFRIDEAGHMRFAAFMKPGTGQRRVGRIVQRLCEIETYKSMSMLGFTRVRNVAAQLNALDEDLTGLMGHLSDKDPAEGTLHRLLDISARLEDLSAKCAYRLTATEAYEAIVNQRIQVLREERFEGRQTFSEFMMRRYEPAMRTVKSTEARIRSMSERSVRAATLLRTRVDVERSAQNQLLLESMDRRADQQLRLQRTVEGLSVVAISYYAVSLAAYLVYPLQDVIGLSKGQMTALITVPVVLGVWWMIRRLRRAIE